MSGKKDFLAFLVIFRSIGTCSLYTNGLVLLKDDLANVVKPEVSAKPSVAKSMIFGHSERVCWLTSKIVGKKKPTFRIWSLNLPALALLLKTACLSNFGILEILRFLISVGVNGLIFPCNKRPPTPTIVAPPNMPISLLALSSYGD